jgi:hypothetical protein
MNSIAPRALLAGDFRKSSFSTDTDDPQCVYVANRSDLPTVEVRDSKRGLDMPGFMIDTGAFRAFIAGINCDDPTAH